MVMKYYLSLKDETVGSLEAMLTEKGLLTTKDGKKFLCYYGPEELFYMEHYPDEKLPYLQTDIDSIGDKAMEWCDTTGDSEYAAYYVSTILKDIKLKFHAGYRDMAGTPKTDVSETLMNGYHVDDQGKKCIWSLKQIPGEFIEDLGEKIRVSVPIYKTNRSIKATFPKKDYLDGRLYIRKKTEKRGEKIENALRNYWLDVEYEMMCS